MFAGHMVRSGDPKMPADRPCAGNFEEPLPVLRRSKFRLWSFAMIEWIVILLVVAAIASLLGFRGVAGVSAGIAKVLILIVLVGFLLLLFFGVIAFA